MSNIEFVSDLLGQASAIANRRFGTVSGVGKGSDPNQVVTETDLEIGSFLIAAVEHEYSGHNVVDEEAGARDRGSAFTWVIDPIDGTSNFGCGVPTYAIMLGLLEEAQPVAGGIAVPAHNLTVVASKGAGAFSNGARIRVTEETNLLSVLVAYGMDSHREAPERTREEMALLAEIVLNVRNVRCSNSAFDAVMLAEGRYGASLNQSSRIWDNVAQQIVLEEAGALYTDFWGRPMDYTNPTHRADANYTWCSAPPALHRSLQEIIRGARG